MLAWLDASLRPWFAERILDTDEDVLVTAPEKSPVLVLFEIKALASANVVTRSKVRMGVEGISARNHR
ncbi:hypothetical protein DF3PA_310008 [Candidatus Defluviicoccus seviourii]|uniref:Uncharacterized protein n=1 Tax=Candidatus Defluviicoccus seviourii TaxID=2565273 RepID=A0A564WHI0_9PROT|nr:hypothetical protein DF3PA_310008 [Candidatus Defluviicoccus seviourii]